MANIERIAAQIAPQRGNPSGPKAIRKAAQALAGCLDLEAVVSRAIAIKALREARGGWRTFDPLIRARDLRRNKVTALKQARQAETWLASLQIAAVWTTDRRDEAARFARVGMRDAAHDAVVAATLEAVARLARTRWGWAVRHRSTNRAGQKGSTYIVIRNVGEVRLSDHEVPLYGERAERYEERGARWGEIIVGRHQLGWSLTKWRRMLIMAAARRV